MVPNDSNESPTQAEAPGKPPTPIDVQLEYAAQRLSEELKGTFNRETVERVLLDEVESMRDSRVETFVPLIAERHTRELLREVARTDPKVEASVPSILFLCTHNAGRSQIAAGWVRRLAGPRVRVYSGGSEPGSEVNPTAVQAMAEAGVDISGEQPKPWTDEVIQSVDVVVTMGCGDACPVFPGIKYVDWEVADPAGQDLEAVRAIRDDIEERVRELLDGLRVEVSASG
jgi:arsenate reductase (thioredoxin)